MTQSNAGYWYLNRHMLAAGQIFRTLKGSLVKLDRQVEGDSAKWYVAIWHKGWANYNTTIEPSELSGPQLPEPSAEGGNPKADGYRFLVGPDGVQSAWVHPLDATNPKHTGWADCTDMSDDKFHAFIVERQGTRPQIVAVAVGA